VYSRWMHDTTHSMTERYAEELDSSRSILPRIYGLTPHVKAPRLYDFFLEIQRITNQMPCTSTIFALPNDPCRRLTTSFYAFSLNANAIKYHRERERKVRAEVEFEEALMASS
jgi:hypothetical protein